MSAIYYLDLEDVLVVAGRAVGGAPQVRDYGLLESALARPQSSVFGQDAYPDIWSKAAALLESLGRNHALVDGNKRLAWTAAWVFLEVNGHALDGDFDVDEAETFMLAAVTGALELQEIAETLPRFAARDRS